MKLTKQEIKDAKSLYRNKGFKPQEIAEALNLPYDEVKSNFNRIFSYTIKKDPEFKSDHEYQYGLNKHGYLVVSEKKNPHIIHILKTKDYNSTRNNARTGMKKRQFGNKELETVYHTRKDDLTFTFHNRHSPDFSKYESKYNYQSTGRKVSDEDFSVSAIQKVEQKQKMRQYGTFVSLYDENTETYLPLHVLIHELESRWGVEDIPDDREREAKRRELHNLIRLRKDTARKRWGKFNDDYTAVPSHQSKGWSGDKYLLDDFCNENLYIHGDVGMRDASKLEAMSIDDLDAYHNQANHEPYDERTDVNYHGYFSKGRSKVHSPHEYKMRMKGITRRQQLSIKNKLK